MHYYLLEGCHCGSVDLADCYMPRMLYFSSEPLDRQVPTNFPPISRSALVAAAIALSIEQKSRTITLYKHYWVWLSNAHGLSDYAPSRSFIQT